MRSPGAIPRYPLLPKAARERAAQLTARCERLTDRMAREGGSDEDWEELRGWREELDAITSALETLDRIIPTLPRCGCGKLVHEGPESAAQHARLLRLIDGRVDPREVVIYECRVVRRDGVFHVGHVAPPPTLES